MKKLHFGCGMNLLPGWLNTDRKDKSSEPIPEDVEYMVQDLYKPFPFQDSSFSYIFTEHTIEHFPFDHGVRILKECRRCLAPNGVLRISVPDLSHACYEYFSGNAAEFHNSFLVKYAGVKHMPTSAHWLNTLFYGYGHKCIYDESMMRYALHLAGFQIVSKMEVGVSSDSNLVGIERRIWKKNSALDSLVVEARITAS